MSQKISDFKAGFNGGSRANRFLVDITWPSITDIATPTTLQYHAVAAKLPQAELGSISVPYRGRVAFYAGDREYDPWKVTILDDTGSNASWHAFHAWAEALSSHATNTAADQYYAASSAAGSSTTVYLKDVTITQLLDPVASGGAGPGYADGKTITLKHAWPSEVGQITFDMGDGGSLISFDVTFTYDYYTIDSYS